MAIIKFYYNMMNGHLPDDFNCFKPHTSISCTRYSIRNPIMQYPFTNPFIINPFISCINHLLTHLLLTLSFYLLTLLFTHYRHTYDNSTVADDW